MLSVLFGFHGKGLVERRAVGWLLCKEIGAAPMSGRAGFRWFETDLLLPSVMLVGITALSPL